MPRLLTVVSGRSLCCSTTVDWRASVAGSSTSSSPPFGTPPTLVCTAAVPSPGSGGVMKRVASRRVPAASSARCRTFGPTSTLLPTTPAADTWAIRPLASSDTSAVPSARTSTP